MRRKLQVMIGPEDLAIWGQVNKLFASKGPGSTRFCSIKETCRVLKRENVFAVFCENRLMDGTFEDLLTASKRVRSRTRIVVSSMKMGWRDITTHLQMSESGTREARLDSFGPRDAEWVVICTIRDKEAVCVATAWHGRF